MTEEETAKVAIARLDGWIPHDGGTCPEVARWNKSEVILRGGSKVVLHAHMSMLWPWKNDHFTSQNIMAYRIIKWLKKKSPPQ